MARRSRFSQEVRERAVRMVVEQRGRYGSEWETMRSIAEKIGCSAETPRKWVRQIEVDSGLRDGVKSDNGPEFVAKQVQAWIEERNVAVRFIDPGSPWQNGHNESFNGVFRDGCLNRWLFESVREAREATEAWLQEYNVERPHGSLGGRVPTMFFEPWEERKREAA